MKIDSFVAMTAFVIVALTSSSCCIAFTSSHPSRIQSVSSSTTGTYSGSTTSLLVASTDEDSDSRRGFLVKSLGGLAAVGITANGVAVQGPSPYIPAAVSPSYLTDKLIVITGGNTGLGLESGKRLAAAGATVVLTSRNVVKGQRAVDSVVEYVQQEQSTGGASIVENEADIRKRVYTVPLDLCDLESVKAFPSKLQNTIGDGSDKKIQIDVLLNNAGVMAVPDLQITKDGYEKTFQSNHLGHFALTSSLVPMLNPSGSRVINVSSMAYLIIAASSTLDMSNLNGEKEYKPWDAYGRSKLENILFTKELQRRADEAGKKITAVALHPGSVRTDLPRYLVGEDKFVSMQDAKPTALDVAKLLPAFYFTKSVERGANSQIYLAAGGDEKEGKDVDVRGKFFVNMKENKLLPPAMDMEKAGELWRVSEEMSGVKFDL